MVCSPLYLVAQSYSTSPYSVYGLGLLNPRASILNRTMGGTGIAVQDGENLNLTNPASYVRIKSPISHIYEVGFNMDVNRYSTQQINETKTTGSLNSLIYWFKFKPWWASTLGLAPYTSTSYSISTQRETIGTKVNYWYEGAGNISQLYWGNSFALNKNLSVGFHTSYLFGSITKNESLEPTEESIITMENKITARKIKFDVGLQYQIELTEEKSLVSGIVWDNQVSFTGKVNRLVTDETGDTLQLSTEDKKKYTLPTAAGFGLALHTPRSIIATDIRTEEWSTGTLAEDNIQLADTWKFSAGYTYRGNPNAMTYLSSIGLRAGFYAQNSHLIIKGTNLTGWGLSAGLAFPVFDGKSTVNLSYQFDKLGTTNNELILQQSQKISIDLVIRDLWGIRRKFD